MAFFMLADTFCNPSLGQCLVSSDKATKIAPTKSSTTKMAIKSDFLFSIKRKACILFRFVPSPRSFASMVFLQRSVSSLLRFISVLCVSFLFFFLCFFFLFCFTFVLSTLLRYVFGRHRRQRVLYCHGNNSESPPSK